eukprot:444514_1
MQEYEQRNYANPELYLQNISTIYTKRKQDKQLFELLLLQSDDDDDAKQQQQINCSVLPAYIQCIDDDPIFRELRDDPITDALTKKALKVFKKATAWKLFTKQKVYCEHAMKYPVAVNISPTSLINVICVIKYGTDWIYSCCMVVEENVALVFTNELDGICLISNINELFQRITP